MKKSSNAERKRRQKLNRIKTRNRFRERSLDESADRPSLGLSFSLFFKRHKAGIFNTAMVSLTAIFIFTGYAAYAKNINDSSKEVCRLSYTELRTYAKADDFKPKNNDLKRQIASITKNTPMARMINDISKHDRAVAAFIVGIAMKESKFGVYSPKKDGRECFNYWGYRGKENTTKSGYSCFDSPAHAIKVVGGKINSMVKQGAKTPAQMISWKCGSSCAGHDPVSVTKWISDVAINYYKLNPPNKLAKKI